MEMIFASSNEHKTSEMRALLRDLGAEVKSLRDVGFSGEIVENGTTFAENAMIKASTVAAAFPGKTVFADDSGIAVDALGGEPGIYSARYGGDKCEKDVDRTALLLKNMEGKSDRTAKFVCAIACVTADGERFVVEGECRGKLDFEPKGSDGFGYDPIFIPDGYDRTMGEISPAEKNKISHRARAISLFIDEMRRRA